MSGSVWDLSGTYERCASTERCNLYRPGHAIHWIHFNQSVRRPGDVIPVSAHVDERGVVRIEGDDVSLIRWNHRPDLLWDVLNKFGGTAVWKPRWHLLAVPTDTSMGGARTMFNLATHEQRDGVDRRSAEALREAEQEARNAEMRVLAANFVDIEPLRIAKRYEKGRRRPS